MHSRPFLSAGEYIGYRLLQLGVSHVFCVPGDFNLSLLDALGKVPGLTIVGTASELGCAYAAGKDINTAITGLQLVRLDR